MIESSPITRAQWLRWIAGAALYPIFAFAMPPFRRSTGLWIVVAVLHVCESVARHRACARTFFHPDEQQFLSFAVGAGLSWLITRDSVLAVPLAITGKLLTDTVLYVVASR